MTRVPTPLIRGLTVLALGATLALSHAAFAAAGSGMRKADNSAPIALGSTSHDDRKVTAWMPLAENCYLETSVERTPQGKIVSKLVQDCD